MKKYIITGLLIWFGFIVSAQVMLPAYQGVFSRKILSSGGVASNGLDFDGVDDRVISTNDIKFQISVGTIEGWIKTGNAGSNYCGAFGKTFAYLLYIYNNELIVYDWGGGGNRTTGITLNDNNWHHIAMSFNSGVNNGTLIYIDGALKLTTTMTILNQGEPFTIGGVSGSYNQFYTGSIDDVRVWNVARSIEQIQANMNKELLGTEAGLVAYYPFNQGIAAGNNTAITLVTDKTANAINGTLTNFAKTGATSNFVVGKVETPIITNGLVLNLDAGNSASYPGSGTIWKDISGLGNNGTLINSPSYNSANGGSLVFNGSNTYVSAPLTKTASCTFSAWAKSSSLPTESMLFNAGNNGSGPDLFLSFGVISWNTWDSSNNPFGNIPATAGNGIWHHYVLVNDAVANNAKLYYDGVLYGTAAYRTAAATTTLYIGGNNSAYMWNGAIATFSVYNRSLIASEVLQNYNAQKGRFGL